MEFIEKTIEIEAPVDMVYDQWFNPQPGPGYGTSGLSGLP
jgi:hypothetical protein